MIEKRKKESKKNDAQEKIGNKRELKRERRMQSIESPKVPKNNAQESLEKTITGIHRQFLEEIGDTVEDTTYNMPPHDDEFDSDDEVLVKRMKKIKQVSNSKPK